MESKKDNSEKIQELQILEQNLRAISMQKQQIQIELNETLNALEELKKTNDEVYKMISGIMLKSSKEDLIKELNEKKKIIELRISSLTKQEDLIEAKSSELRKELSFSNKTSDSEN